MAKYKRVSLGYKIKEEVTKVKPKSDMSYPTFYVHDKKLPLEEENIGKMLNVSARIKLVGLREENRDGRKSLDYDFEIREITF